MRPARGIFVTAAAVVAVAATVAAANADVFKPKIEGGELVTSAPWAVQVEAAGGFCSGTIIAPRWVLTAAHCIDDEGTTVPVDSVSVRVGSVKLGQGEQADAVRLERIHDTALIELDRSIDTQYQQLADADPPIGAITTIAGFGKTCSSTQQCKISPQLKQATNRVTAITDNPDEGRMIVSTGVSGAARSGDSGGPEFYQGRQVGVLCCGTDTSDNYGSVASHRQWIKERAGV